MAFSKFKPGTLTLTGGVLAMCLLSAGFGSDLIIGDEDCTGFTASSNLPREVWQQGQGLLIIRHTERCSPDKGNCPEGDLGITPEGVSTAHLIGDGVSSLGEAPVDILYSPALRTEMTAKVAFDGHPLDAADWLVEGCKQDFMDKAKDTKREGRNLVLVTHSSCLNALEDELSQPMLRLNAGDDEFFGASFMFELGEVVSTWKPMGCMLPTEWATNGYRAAL